MAYEIAVPEEDTRTFADYLDALKRRRRPALLIALAILVAGVVGIFVWPNAYTSSAVILIEDPDVPPGLVPSTVTTFAARQVQYINQRVMTRTNLASIIEKFNLFEKERKYLPTLMLVDEVQKDIKIDVIDVQLPDAAGRAVTSTIAFTLGFEHESPQVARQVANELVSLYLAENVRSRTEQTSETSQFLQAEVERMDAEVRDLEVQISQIKQQNEGSLPELRGFNMQVMQNLENELREIDRRIQSIQDSKIMLGAQLAQLSPMATTVLPDGKPVSPPEDQLRALQTQLAMLEGRYSADHPDVVRTRRDLEAVRTQLGTNVDATPNAAALADARLELAKAREKYSAEHPEVQRLERSIANLESRFAEASPGREVGSLRPDNPVYIQIEAQKRGLEAEERSLRDKQNALRARINELERNTLRSADVEKDLSALQRRLLTATAAYQAARERLSTARMGQALETQSKGERFALVEPPDLPLQPSSPNRPVLLALLVILTLAAGLGWPQIAESMDAAINSPRAVESVQGAPPIAEIPVIETAEDKRHERQTRLTGLVIVPVAGVVVLAIIHFFIINIDVAWYVLLRKLGM